MLVRYHMTRGVYTFTPSTTAADALEEMRAYAFRSAPVVQDEAMVGFVTERDLLRILPGSLVGQEAHAASGGEVLLVAHAMTREVVHIRPNDHIEDAARVLFERRIHGLPVLDDGQLVGVITASDLLQTLMENDAAREGHRVTWQVPVGRDSVDVAKLCARNSMRMLGLLRHEAKGGALLATARVTGTAGQLERLLEDLRQAGAVLIETRPAQRGAA